MNIIKGTQFTIGIMECIVVGFYNIDSLNEIEQVPMLPTACWLRDTPSPLAYVGVKGFATGIPLSTRAIERMLNHSAEATGETGYKDEPLG